MDDGTLLDMLHVWHTAWPTGLCVSGDLVTVQGMPQLSWTGGA